MGVGSFRLSLNNKMSEHWKEWGGWHGSGQMGARWCHRQSVASTSVPSALACWHMPWAWHLDEAVNKRQEHKHHIKLYQAFSLLKEKLIEWIFWLQDNGRVLKNKNKEAQETHHSSELVKLWFEIWSPEVDISSFVSHLITVKRQNKTKLRLPATGGPKIIQH